MENEMFEIEFWDKPQQRFVIAEFSDNEIERAAIEQKLWNGDHNTPFPSFIILADGKFCAGGGDD
jgi:hypothetical protein